MNRSGWFRLGGGLALLALSIGVTTALTTNQAAPSVQITNADCTSSEIGASGSFGGMSASCTMTFTDDTNLDKDPVTGTAFNQAAPGLLPGTNVGNLTEIQTMTTACSGSVPSLTVQNCGYLDHYTTAQNGQVRYFRDCLVDHQIVIDEASTVQLFFTNCTVQVKFATFNLQVGFGNQGWGWMGRGGTLHFLHVLWDGSDATVGRSYTNDPNNTCQGPPVVGSCHPLGIVTAENAPAGFTSYYTDWFDAPDAITLAKAGDIEWNYFHSDANACVTNGSPKPCAHTDNIQLSSATGRSSSARLTVAHNYFACHNCDSSQGPNVTDDFGDNNWISVISNKFLPNNQGTPYSALLFAQQNGNVISNMTVQGNIAYGTGTILRVGTCTAGFAAPCFIDVSGNAQVAASGTITFPWPAGSGTGTTTTTLPGATTTTTTTVPPTTTTTVPGATTTTTTIPGGGGPNLVQTTGCYTDGLGTGGNIGGGYQTTPHLCGFGDATTTGLGATNAGGAGGVSASGSISCTATVCNGVTMAVVNSGTASSGPGYTYSGSGPVRITGTVGDATHGLRVNGAEVTVNAANLTIWNLEEVPTGNSGITLCNGNANGLCTGSTNAANVTIRNCDIQGSANSHAFIGGASGSGNSSTAIFVQSNITSVGNFTIDHCNLEGYETPIQGLQTGNWIVTNNYIHHVTCTTACSPTADHINGFYYGGVVQKASQSLLVKNNTLDLNVPQNCSSPLSWFSDGGSITQVNGGAVHNLFNATCGVCMSSDAQHPSQPTFWALEYNNYHTCAQGPLRTFNGGGTSVGWPVGVLSNGLTDIGCGNVTDTGTAEAGDASAAACPAVQSWMPSGWPTGPPVIGQPYP